MKLVLPALLFLLFVSLALGEEANGLRLSVQKTVLDRTKDRAAFVGWDRVEKALGLKVSAKNVSMKEKASGTIEYAVVVKKYNYSPLTLHKYTGTEPFPALKPSAEANLTIGKVPMSGYNAGGNRKEYQDSIEGWQVVVKHEGVETLKITSTGDFAKLLARAKDGPKE
jgi:hypothetical protein